MSVAVAAEETIAPDELLVTDRLTKNFGGIRALSELDLRIPEGFIHSVIGPNGAGKTTLFNVITGVEPVSGGSITYRGQPITNYPSHKVVHLGIRRTFQNIRLFEEQTVIENVMLGQHVQAISGLESLFTVWSASERDRRHQAYQLLDELGIAELAERQASGLAYGPKRLVEIARAMASNPHLLLLDEPTSGMNHTEIDEVCERIRQIRDRGVTIVLIEHHMEVVAELSDTITVLNFGEKIAEGSYKSVANDPSVIEAYLGRDETE